MDDFSDLESLDYRTTSVKLSSGRRGNRIGLSVKRVGVNGLYAIMLAIGGEAGITLESSLQPHEVKQYFEHYKTLLEYKRTIRLDSANKHKL